MKHLLLFAVKNLARYRRRTIITASAVALGIAMFIFVDGWLLGAELESDRNIVWYETSSARVMHPEYWEERDRLPLNRVIEDPENVLAALDAAAISAAPRTVFSADLVVWYDPFEEDGSMPVRVYAIDPSLDDTVFRFKSTIESGRYLEQDDAGVLLGSWLAEDLGAKVGYPIALITRTRDGFFQTIDAEIVGIVNCPNPIINRSSVFITLSSADAMLQMEGAVTEINLGFTEHADLEEKTAITRKVLADAGISHTLMHWRELAPEYSALTQAKDAGSGIILMLLFIIAAVGISNTMLMAVYERVTELGMLRAIGMKDRDIRLLFMFEAGAIGFIGSAIGVLLGVLINLYMVNFGIDFSWMIRTVDIGYRSSGIFYGAWNPVTMAQAFFTGIILCFAVAYVPTRRAMTMKITDCLRHT